MPEIISQAPLKLPEKLARNARNQLEKWYLSVRETQNCADLPADMETAISSVFAFSNFVAQTCLRNPMLLLDLVQSEVLLHPYPAGTHDDRLKCRLNQLCASASVSSSDIGNLAMSQVEQCLRRYRQQEMVRIAFRDLAGWSHLTETLCDLSELADACIQNTLAYLSGRYLRKNIKKGSVKPRLVVLGMGKLGARELNFSSDVDLIFAFADSTLGSSQLDRAQMQEVCLTIARELVQMLSRNTAEGFVFRVDTRLRPYGDGGPLAMSFDNLENYYQAQGREWERYAMIKARVVAGDPTAGKELLDRLKPFVYRRYLDFGSFESLREMKEKVRIEVQRNAMQQNIKLGAGGIREIEFFGQIFQLIRGGVISELQDRRILKVLQLLAQHRIVAPKVSQELTCAYIFLRRTENRLQEMEDQQTHLLPTNAGQRLRLALAMGFKTWDEFDRQLIQYREMVHHHFNHLLSKKKSEGSGGGVSGEIKKLRILWQDQPESEEMVNTLAKTGFDAPKEAAITLARFRDDFHTRALSATGQDRLNRLMPLILKAVGQQYRSGIVLERVLDLLKSIQRRTSYLALLLEYPGALSHLIQLAAASPWILSFLSRHPVLLDELLDPRTLYSPPTKKSLRDGLNLRLRQEPADDLEHQMDVLRIYKQINILRVAASDVKSILPLMQVSDRLSDIAEIILDQVVALSWLHLVQKHGNPQCQLNGQRIEKGFAVIAYGKLGGLELGYGSDLDLVFLHCATSGQTQGGSKPIENNHFFSRLGQRVIHMLSAHTAAGVLYDVDMRLRPSGSAGVLVSHVDGYRNYQLKDAWTWEHQALIRARAICGDRELIIRFEEIRKEVLTHSAPAEQLKHDVVEMRKKMRNQHMSKDAGSFDLKQGSGGLVDIEFLVQYLVLLNARWHPKLLDWTDNVRLLQVLTETGVMDELTAYRLRRAYLVYRAVIHRCNLQEKAAHISLERFNDLKQWVHKIWEYFLR